MKAIVLFFILVLGFKAYAGEEIDEKRLERMRMFDQAESIVEDSEFTRKEVQAGNNKKNFREVASEKDDKWFKEMDELMVTPEELDQEPEYR